MIDRRRLLVGMPLLIVAVRWGDARAEPFPHKTVRLIAGHPPGGQADVIARIVGPKLAEILAQTVVNENRAGAAGMIAMAMVAKAPPDGHTLLICSSANLALARVMVSDLPYDPTRDFAMIARVASIPTVLAVGNWIPATTALELVEYARARPGQLTAGSSGNGSSSGFSLEMLKAAAGIDVLQVPYSGLAPAVKALLSRQVDMVFADFALVSLHAKNGTLRLVGTPASRRLAVAPDLPTLEEQGLHGVVIDVWVGIVAPAAIPRETLVKLTSALGEVMRMPDVRQRLMDVGFEPLEDTPAQFTASVQTDIQRFSAIAERLRIGAKRQTSGDQKTTQ